MGLRSFYRSIVRRGKTERDMHEEMGAHIAQTVERLKRRGLSDADARAAAQREFGNVAYLQEEARDARGGQSVETLVRDVRFAFRHFARTPLTAITLVLVLSVGIGVNAALFSFLQALTMRYAPAVPADDALVRIRGTVFSRSQGSLDPRGLSMPEIMDLSRHTGTFSAVAGYAEENMVFDAGDGSEPRVLGGHYVTPNYFATLGVRPVLGAGLPIGNIDDTPGAELAVVIGHKLWEQLGGDSAVIGRVVRVNDVPVRIVGVAPPRFMGPVLDADDDTALWTLIAARAALTRGTSHALTSRDSAFFDAVGRLTPNTSVEQATAVVRVVATTWAPAKRPDENVEYSSDVVAARGFTNVMDPGSGSATIALNATGGILILLIACTNVSALLLGAAVARRREIAIRLSLGASRWRVIRQMLTESSLLALAGGALGVTLYWWIIKLVVWYYGDVPFGPDLGTVGFTALFALGTGILFGLSPALHATRLDVASALKSAGGGASSRSRLQRTFIVVQILLTQPLLVGIAMVIGGVLDEAGEPVSSLKDRVAYVQFGVSAGGGSSEDRIRRTAEFMERVAAVPGVEDVVPQPSTIDIADWRVHPADRGAGPRAQESVLAAFDGAPPGYFEFQNIPIQRGRDLMASDTIPRGDMPVIVETGFARGFWGAQDPIGKRLELTSRLFKQDGRAMVVPAVVVGVFDTTVAPLRGTRRVYTASGPRWRKDAYLVRTRGPAEAVVPTIRQMARSELPDIPLSGSGVTTLAELDRISQREMMQVGAGATAGGIIALILASIGLYGVVALAVRQRQREIGVRVALGALPRQVIRMFFLSGIRLSMIGIVLGLPLSAGAVYFIATEFGESLPPLNKPLVGAGIAVAVIAVAALASWVPARRAAVVDPLVAIRAD